MLCAALLVASPFLLFTMNGMLLGYGNTPVIKQTDFPEGENEPKSGDSLKIMAFNIAKCFAHKGGLEFDDAKNVNNRVTGIAELIKEEQPDLVFLSETLLECTRCPVNQVEEIARQSGMHSWAFGENYNFGLPFYRVIGGNAILSRWPLEPVANCDLAGRKPFYITKNNRRVLWCSLKLGGQTILLASVHNDSFDLKNNLKQVKEILAYCDKQPAIFAGDFNANPKQEPIQEILKHGFVTASSNENTFPANKPRERIDFVFAPQGWNLVEHRVLQTSLSDHLPIVSTFVIGTGLESRQ